MRFDVTALLGDIASFVSLHRRDSQASYECGNYRSYRELQGRMTSMTTSHSHLPVMRSPQHTRSRRVVFRERLSREDPDCGSRDVRAGPFDGRPISPNFRNRPLTQYGWATLMKMPFVKNYVSDTERRVVANAVNKVSGARVQRR